MTVETRAIEGTVIAITGATSGIGRATARLLASKGALVAITGRRKDRLSDLATEIGADHCVWVPGDIKDPETSTRLIQAAIDRFGHLDSLIAAAGWGAYGGVLEGTDSELADMVEANFLGTVWAVRAAVREMRSGGDLIIISSVAGLRGGANEAVYAGTKAAQLIFAGAVDREVRTSGIRVTTVCPAGVNTEFALGRGRAPEDPALDDFLSADDIASSALFALQQPRRMRTTQWSMWSAVEGS